MQRPLETVRGVAGGLARWARGGVVRRMLPHAQPIWASVDLVDPPPETVLPGPQGALGLLPLLRNLDTVARVPEVAGLRIELGAGLGGLAGAEAIRRALLGLKRSGKSLLVWAESLDLASLYVASVADRIWVPDTGRLALLGLRAEGFYLRDALEKWDVRPEVVRIGSHKSAGEMFTRSDMSDEQREQLEALLDTSYSVLVDGIAEGRGLGADAVRTAIDAGTLGTEAAIEAGLIDAAVYRDDWEERFDAERADWSGVPGRPAFVALPQLVTGIDAPRASDAWHEPPRVAYLVAEGTLHRGEGARGIGSEAWESRLHQLAADRRVRAVVLRIDSPGGDALASDLLWRALRTLRREKPVVASIASVAASGGYYLACAADVIFAERASVTGSIGVIGGKLDLSGLYERLGVGRDGVERGARAGMLSESRGFREDERRAVEAEMRELYTRFVARVAEGRGMEPGAVAPLAEGRVYSGENAMTAGLVDRLGGPLEALAEARRLAGLRPGERPAIDVHPKPSPWTAVSAWSRRLG